MPYTADKPSRAKSSEELRATIPGWGADLDPADRPSVPKESFDLPPTGAHWEYPDEQPELAPRERSIEHARLTPVFGTAQPLTGLSGVIRRYAYARFSEGRAAHWLLLILGDRVNAAEGHLASFVTTRPDNPITETGLSGEFQGKGFRSRLDANRVDRNHQWIDPLLVAGPWIITGVVLVGLVSKVVGSKK